MPINKLLCLGSVGDGATSYKCLLCGKSWYKSSWDDFIYCPFCGTKWDGEQPNLKMERLGHEYEIKRKKFTVKEVPFYVIVIETRAKSGTFLRDWKVECVIDGRVPAKRAKQIIKEYQENCEDSFMGIEFESRYRQVPYDEKFHFLLRK